MKQEHRYKKRHSKNFNIKLSRKINQNIEATIAAKVLRNQGTFALKDILGAGKRKDDIEKKIKKEKEEKKRLKPPTVAKPEKVHAPRI